jgi:hypothetical protein
LPHSSLSRRSNRSFTSACGSSSSATGINAATAPKHLILAILTKALTTTVSSSIRKIKHKPSWQDEI